MVNLDEMTDAQLARFWQLATTFTTSYARQLFPRVDHTKAGEAVTLMAMYAQARMREHACTDPELRAMHADRAETIKQQLPLWAAWEVTV